MSIYSSTTIPPDMPPAAQEMVFDIIEEAHAIVAREQHPPIVYLINTASGALIQMTLEMPDYVTKMRSLAQAKHTSRMMGADLAVFVSEGWAFPEDVEQAAEKDESVDGAQGRLIRKHGRPGNHPRRREVLFITIETKDRHWMGRANIYPRSGTKKRHFTPVGFIPEAMPAEATLGTFNEFIWRG